MFLPKTTPFACALFLTSSAAFAQDALSITNPAVSQIYGVICAEDNACQVLDHTEAPDANSFSFAYVGTSIDLPFSFQRVSVRYSNTLSTDLSPFPSFIDVEMSGLKLAELANSGGAGSLMNTLIANSGALKLSYVSDNNGKVDWALDANLKSGDYIKVDANLVLPNRPAGAQASANPDEWPLNFFLQHILSKTTRISLEFGENSTLDLLHLPWQLAYGAELETFYATAVDHVTNMRDASGDAAIKASATNIIAVLSFLQNWNTSDHQLSVVIAPSTGEPLETMTLFGTAVDTAIVALSTRLGETLKNTPGTHFLLDASGAVDTAFLTDLVLKDAAVLTQGQISLSYQSN